MALIRDWKDVTFHSTNWATVEPASANLYFPVDNAEVGLSNTQSLKVSKTDYVTLMGLIGVSSPQASETVAGIVEKATDTELETGVSTGGTGAFLFVTPAQIAASLAPTFFQFDSNIDNVRYWYFDQNVNFESISFDTGAIDDLDFRTRTASGTTWTSRGDSSSLATLNTFANTAGGFVLEVSANYDAAFNGFAGANLYTTILI